MQAGRDSVGGSRAVSRRIALRGAAGVAGAAWLVPVVTVISMDSASAASAPPPGFQPENGSLAFTGSDAGKLATAGVATLAVGAVAATVAHKVHGARPGASEPPAVPDPDA